MTSSTERGEKHTPGPWMWYHDINGGIDLRTPHSGQLLVMDYGSLATKRPVLRFAERVDRMGGLMKPARDLLPTNPPAIGFTTIDNPDARLIEAAPDLLAACDNAVQIIEQLIPEPSARGVAEVVLFQLRAAIAKAGGDR